MFQNRLCLRKGTYLASAYLEYYRKKCFASPVRCNPRAALPYQARSQAHTYLPPPPPTKNAGPGQLCVILCLCKAKQTSRRPAAIYTGRDFCSHHKGDTNQRPQDARAPSAPRARRRVGSSTAARQLLGFQPCCPPETTVVCHRQQKGESQTASQQTQGLR